MRNASVPTAVCPLAAVSANASGLVAMPDVGTTAGAGGAGGGGATTGVGVTAAGGGGATVSLVTVSDTGIRSMLVKLFGPESTT